LKKIGHQFRPARGLGLKTMLLLDQIPRPGGGHTVWIASPALVASTVSAILAEAGALDAFHEAWLRQPPWGDDPPRTCRLVLANPPD
jgi:hypothetical protein